MMASSTETGLHSTPVHPQSSSTRPSLERDRVPGHNARQSSIRPHFSVSITPALDNIDPQSAYILPPYSPRAALSGCLEVASQDAVHSSYRGTGTYEWLTITAGVIVSIQVQLLTSSSMASSVIPRAFLTLGMMSELVGVMLVIYFIRFPVNHRQKSRNTLWMILRAVSEAPTFLILTGIMGVAAALVVEMLDVSIGTAIAMSGILFIGVVLCLLAWCLGISGRAERGASVASVHSLSIFPAFLPVSRD